MVSAHSVATDRGSIRTELNSFVAYWRPRIDEWKATNKKHTEKSHAQQFWSDFLRCFGIIPERIDLFERDAARASTGGGGYIDLFWSGVVLGEAKSLGADLTKAFHQALDYLAGGSIGQHEWPRFVLVTDFEYIQLTKLGDNAWEQTFTIDELPDYLDQLMFLAGDETIAPEEEEEASIHASRLMADLYAAMVGEDADEKVGEEAPTDPEDEDWAVQKTSVFLTRILFLLYGDDAGLWAEHDLFYRFVFYDTTGDNLGVQMRAVATEHGIKTHVAMVGKDSQSADRRVALWQHLSDPDEVAAETADRQAMQAGGENPETGELRRQWQEMVDAGLWNHPSRPITGFDHALVRDHLMGGQDFSDALSAQLGQPRRQTGQNNQQEWGTNTRDDGMEL